MRQLEIISCCPGSLYFCAETEVLLSNLRERNLSELTTILVEENTVKEYKHIWSKLQDKFIEVNFYFYDTSEITQLKKLYASIIRPNILKKHFKEHLYLEQKAIFYIDQDVLLVDIIPFYKYLNDDINYLSKTDYISANYFLSKEKDVMPNKKKKWEKIDVLSRLGKIVGISKEEIIAQQENTGGAQYLLKNIDWKFWEKVENDSVLLKIEMQNINNQCFTNERRGLQSWCSDMTSLLWNLWLRGAKTECPSTLDFSWATQPIEEFSKHAIYHNAGVSGKWQELNGEKVKMFHKGESIFRDNIYTFFDLDYSDVDPRYCSRKYVDYIKTIKNPVCKGIKYNY